MIPEAITEAVSFDFIEIQNILIVQIKFDLYDELLIQLQKAVLDYIKVKDLNGVIIDLHGVQLIDSLNLKSLVNLVKMINLLGNKVIFIGFHPGVAAALTEVEVLSLGMIDSAMNTETAILYLTKNTRPKK